MAQNTLPENRVTLVSITKTSGNGYVVRYGWLEEFAFDIPTALRRLADSIEKGNNDKGLESRRPDKNE